jgi:hypothetical protein
LSYNSAKVVDFLNRLVTQTDLQLQKELSNFVKETQELVKNTTPEQQEKIKADAKKIAETMFPKGGMKDFQFISDKTKKINPEQLAEKFKDLKPLSSEEFDILKKALQLQVAIFLLDIPEGLTQDVVHTFFSNYKVNNLAEFVNSMGINPAKNTLNVEELMYLKNITENPLSNAYTDKSINVSLELFKLTIDNLFHHEPIELTKNVEKVKLFEGNIKELVAIIFPNFNNKNTLEKLNIGMQLFKSLRIYNIVMNTLDKYMTKEELEYQVQLLKDKKYLEILAKVSKSAQKIDKKRLKNLSESFFDTKQFNKDLKKLEQKYPDFFKNKIGKNK